MSNNKESSVEWYIIERHNIEIQSRLGLISPIEYDAKLIKIEEQAKAMHKDETIDFAMKFMMQDRPVVTFYNETFNNNEQH
jgi:hypothetical protein